MCCKISFSLAADPYRAGPGETGPREKGRPDPGRNGGNVREHLDASPGTGALLCVLGPLTLRAATDTAPAQRPPSGPSPDGGPSGEPSPDGGPTGEPSPDGGPAGGMRPGGRLLPLGPPKQRLLLATLLCHP